MKQRTESIILTLGVIGAFFWMGIIIMKFQEIRHSSSLISPDALLSSNELIGEETPTPESRWPTDAYPSYTSFDSEFGMSWRYPDVWPVETDGNDEVFKFFASIVTPDGAEIYKAVMIMAQQYDLEAEVGISTSEEFVALLEKEQNEGINKQIYINLPANAFTVYLSMVMELPMGLEYWDVYTREKQYIGTQNIPTYKTNLRWKDESQIPQNYSTDIGYMELYQLWNDSVLYHIALFARRDSDDVEITKGIRGMDQFYALLQSVQVDNL